MGRPGTRVPAIQLRTVAFRYAARGITRLNRPLSQQWRANVWRQDAAHSSEQTPQVDSPEEVLRRMRRLEAVLFLAQETLTSRKLSDHADLQDGTEARTLIRRLNQHYDESGRAFRVERIAGGYQLISRPQFSGWLRRLQHIPKQRRLSAPAMETLAVVAYQQPVIRADIEAVRGVNCGEILRQLMERNLVRISGRSSELGRPFTYATTKHFLKTFGLNNLEGLPRAEMFRGSTVDNQVENLQTEEDPKVSLVTEEQFSEDRQLEATAEEVAISTFNPRLVEDEENVTFDEDSEEVEEEEEYEEEEDEEGEEYEEEDGDEYEEEYEDEDDEEYEEEGEEDDFEDDEWEEVEDDDVEEEWEDDDEDWEEEDEDDEDWEE